jgi:DNA modification methylase
MKLINGDCREALRAIADNSIDSIVTDPPYGLEFMGKDWDQFPTSGGSRMQAFQAYLTPVFEECLRVLKPGGHLLAFGGARTYHRLASAVEDAGFEIRDQLMWLYGSGFPKSMNVGKALLKKGEHDHSFDGWGTTLKPSHEPIVMARKPMAGTVVENIRQYGVGPINIDDCRIARPDGDRTEYGVDGDEKQTTGDSGIYGRFKEVTAYEPHALGRFPANVLHDGSDEVVAEFPIEKGGLSASRFFYCAKANKKDRGDGNLHPTVKPVALMQYLCRLVTPSGGTVLDPCMGSGSTGVACQLEGMDFIGIEREPEYYEIAKGRLCT